MHDESDRIERRNGDDKPMVSVDPFDRQRGSLTGLPGVFRTKPTTRVTMEPVTGFAETFITETWRQTHEPAVEGDKREPSQDWVFLQYIGRDRQVVKVAIPPIVADDIARQRDALVGMVRRKVAKRLAAERKAAGWKPNPAVLVKARAARARKQTKA